MRVGGGLPRFSRPVPLVAYHISTRLTHPNGRWLHRLSRAQDGDVQGLLLGWDRTLYVRALDLAPDGTALTLGIGDLSWLR